MANRKFNELRNEILADPVRADRLRATNERVAREYEASTTDYTPGDSPVPVGSVVEYFGSKTPGRYRIIEHHDPASHPPIKAEEWRLATAEELAEALPRRRGVRPVAHALAIQVRLPRPGGLLCPARVLHRGLTADDPMNADEGLYIPWLMANTGLPPGELERLILGYTRVTSELAQRLEVGTGVPASRWLHLQRVFDRAKEERE